MRVVHAIQSDRFAGVERHVARLARAQVEAGHEVVVIGGETTAMRRAYGGAPIGHRPVRTVGDVVRELRTFAAGADIVHVHMTAAEVAAAAAALMVRRFPPVVATRHFARRRGSGWLSPLIRAFVERRIDGQISVSEYVAQHIDGPSVIIGAGIDTPGGRSHQREDVVIMAQRLELEKRGDLGLRTFAASGLTDLGWRLKVLGDGSQREPLESLARELAIDRHVDFLGYRASVEPFMARAAILLAPCPVEGFGLSVLEAMASGLPVVAADAGGHSELLTGLDDAALYPPTDWGRAGHQLATLALDEERRAAYGRAARTAQQERFVPAVQVRRTGEIYRRVRGTSGDGLVVVSLEAWDDVWRRNQYLVAELLRAQPDLQVLFVEPPADPLHQLSRRRRPRAGQGLRRAGPVDGVGKDQLWLYQPTKALPRRLDARADDRLASQVRRAADRAGLTDPVLWINDPSAARLLDTTGWPALYDITDDWLAAPRNPTEHERLVRDEGLLLDHCAEVVVCSPHLVRTKGAERRVELVTNAVDVERYRIPRARPADLPPGPAVLYVGTIHPDRFDTDVLLETARRLGQRATVVLVGPVVDIDTATREALQDAGVVALGARPWREVPAYLQHAAVLIVPHVINDFTDSLDPIKLYEYRAVGAPVVATPVAGFRDSDDPRVTAVPADRFADAVAAAVTQESRHGPAEDLPTWRGQATRMAQVIARVRRSATPR